MKLNTKYDIKQKIYIPELKVLGKILAIHINNNLTYYVRYFDGKDPKECYFYEEEISLQEEESRLGFRT